MIQSLYCVHTSNDSQYIVLFIIFSPQLIIPRQSVDPQGTFIGFTFLSRPFSSSYTILIMDSSPQRPGNVILQST
jgi:hypothetical protein